MTGMLELFSLCTAFRIITGFCKVTNASLITQARNECVNLFLQSDFTHLFFIDADMGFSGKEAGTLIHFMLSDTEKKYDILSAAYPKKEIHWEHIKLAVEEGLLLEDDRNLSKYAGKFSIDTEDINFSKQIPVETNTANTGFMLIPRKTLEKFVQAYPERQICTQNKELWHSFFDCIIDENTKQFLSEDVMFCQYIRKMGGRIWTIPDLELSHQGLYTYQGHFMKDLEIYPM